MCLVSLFVTFSTSVHRNQSLKLFRPHKFWEDKRVEQAFSYILYFLILLLSADTSIINISYRYSKHPLDDDDEMSGVCPVLSLDFHIQGVFLTGTPPKKLKYGKPSLGVSTVT